MTIHKEGKSILFGLVVILVTINFCVGYFWTPSEEVINAVILVVLPFTLSYFNFLESLIAKLFYTLILY